MADPQRQPGARKSRKPRAIAAVLALLALDYATRVRVEILDELRAGKTPVEAVAEGKPLLGGAGILISIDGVAWLIYRLNKG